MASVSQVLRVVGREGLVTWAQEETLDAVREALADRDLADAVVALVRERLERRRAEATAHGNAVHRAVARALRGDPYEPDLSPYVRSARRFLADYGLRVWAVERQVSSHLGFLGVVDLLATDGEGLVLVEWKTGHVGREQALQLGAYALAAEEAGLVVRRGYLVGLREDGYEAMEIDLSVAKRGFLGALAVHEALESAALFSDQRQVQEASHVSPSAEQNGTRQSPERAGDEAC